MEKYVLQVENLGKRYDLNRQHEVSLLEDMKAKWGRLSGKEKSKPVSKDIWALRGISFGLEKGDVLGIIGKNGAGKSTLLKMLAEVTAPTEGRIAYSGNLTSILEVGTGFHPDLTGRQNVFLSASLVGLEKGQIEERFDEIVEFSGIAPFIDVPVKQYSSGMYMRLAFSLAFHTDMDILVLDEVLSVGDVDFRMKSAQRIKEISRSGTTVILVSHELPSIRDLCTKCMLLEKGKMVAFGSTLEIVEAYLLDFWESVHKGEAGGAFQAQLPTEHPQVRFLGLELHAKGKSVGEPICMSDAIQLGISFEKKTDHEHLDIVLNITELEKLILTDCPIYRKEYENQPEPPGIYRMEVTIPGNLFHAGSFFVGLLFGDKGENLLELPYLQRFQVQLDAWEEDAKWNEGRQEFPFRPQLHWKLTRVSAAQP